MKLLLDLKPKEKIYMALTIVLFLLQNISGLAILFTILRLVQGVIIGTLTQDQVSPYWISIAILVVFKGVFEGLGGLFEHYTGFEVVHRVRKDITNRLKKFSLGFYTNEKLGEINSIVHEDVDNLLTIVGRLWTTMTADIITSILIGTVMFYINWKMGILMISLVPLGLITLLIGTKSTQKLKEINKDTLGDMVSYFVEYTRGIPLLKAFHENPIFYNRMKDKINVFNRTSNRFVKKSAAISGLSSLFIELCLGVLVVSGTFMFLNNVIDTYVLVIFFVFAREFYKPVSKAESYWAGYIKAKDSYNRVLKITDAPIIDSSGKGFFPKRHSITFNNVGFSYDNEGFSMDDISFKLNEGSMTALVGPSGSGKSTITNLLLRFWDVNRGEIKIDDKDLYKMDYNDFLQNTSIVMQNVTLFAGSIMDNIKVGKSSASYDQVVEVAKKSMIHDFIMTLPEQYNTILGENGSGLSGGQKQRLSIARAFIKEAPILILDEATSSVDPINERKIQVAINNLAKEKTVIVIAHHLNTIKEADNIIVFNDGKIKEMGKHNELLNNKSLYSKLWDAQEEAKKSKIIIRV